MNTTVYIFVLPTIIIMNRKYDGIVVIVKSFYIHIHQPSIYIIKEYKDSHIYHYSLFLVVHLIFTFNM